MKCGYFPFCIHHADGLLNRGTKSRSTLKNCICSVRILDTKPGDSILKVNCIVTDPPAPSRRSAPGKDVAGCAPTPAAPYIRSYSGPYIGIDEAGRGCLAGPAVAAAVLFPPEWSVADILARLPGLNDSKKLSAAARAALAPRIREQALAWGVGLSAHDEIDRINILNATFRAMSRAATALHCRLIRGRACPRARRDDTRGPGKNARLSLPPLAVDGNHPIPSLQWEQALPVGMPSCIEELCHIFFHAKAVWNDLAPTAFTDPLESSGAADLMAFTDRMLPVHTTEAANEDADAADGDLAAVSIALAEVLLLTSAKTAPELPPQKAIIGGDGNDPAIAAASILAKTTRDALMRQWDELYPGYGFAAHKGYGTKAHLDALAAKGPCALHRMSFRKVRSEESDAGSLGVKENRTLKRPGSKKQIPGDQFSLLP